jgi:hypothetical protein
MSEEREEYKLSRITLFREVEPENLGVKFILRIDDEYITNLNPQDIATLRGLLAEIDETIPPQIGEPLSMPTRLRNGRTVYRVTQELLEE